MPTDAYVRFGDSGDVDDNGNPTPLIQGDCTDDMHENWCELRDTSFGLNFPDKEKAGDGASKAKAKQNVNFDKVSLKKRVDWASTQLFLKCCQASKAKVAKADTDVGTIDDVTVEICKRVDIKKSFPYVVVRYKNVRVLEYSIDMSDPEPTETITFEYDKFIFGFQKTSPLTGEPRGEVIWTSQIESTKKTPAGTQNTDSASGGDSSGTAVAGAGAAAAAATGSGTVQTAANAAPAAGNSSAGLASATDAALSANFPGLWSADGFGPLPD